MLAIRKRLARFGDVRLTLIHSHDRLLPRFPERAARLRARVALFKALGGDITLEDPAP